MTKIIDTHAHYYHKLFGKDVVKLINEMQDSVSVIINIGTNDYSNKKVLQMAKDYDMLYSMIGFFPNDVLELERAEIKQFFEAHINDKKNLGIGEIGLDYHWNKVSHSEQKKFFRYQIELAIDNNLPVSIHSRNAEEDTFKILNDYSKSLRCVIHCYSNGLDDIYKYIEMGLYFGIGGTSTYPSNSTGRECIKNIPIGRILLETDAPYLSPQPVRKEINKSSNIIYVAENIAKIKGISVEDVLSQNKENVFQLFKI